MTRKLPKAERRAQLMETALAMVREQGADAVTLAALAERAGVSKPIAYNHFDTRAGLMVALYRGINDRQVGAVRTALARTSADLGEIARLLARAYMDCHEDVGPEFHAIGAALKGDPEMEAYQREMFDGYVALFARALAPQSPLPPEEVERRCIAVIGAAEALSGAMIRGRLDKAGAADRLASLIETWLAAAPG